MRFIQIAAIAVTVIIALPIGMGYMMAFDETETAGWRSTETTNLSDMILNSETEYYSVSTAPGNNSELLYTDLLGGETTIVAPDYVTTSPTVTSLPEYSQNTTVVSKPATSSNTYTGNSSPFTISVNGGQVPADVTAYGIVTVSTEQLSEYHAGDDISPFSGSITFKATDSGLLSDLSPVALNSSSLFVTDRVPNTFTVSATPWKDLSVSSDWSSTMDSGAIRLTGDSISYISIDGLTEIVKIGSVLIVGGESFNGVSGISFASMQDLIVSQSVLNPGSYAQPSDGWRVPALSGAYSAAWINGQRNSSVTMYAQIPAGSFATYDIGSNELTLSRSAAGVVTFDVGNGTYRLGNYGSLQIVFNMESVTISGIRAWPTMYVEPVKINTITADYPDPLEDPFLSITITDESDLVYRVDAASIVAGTFPSTKDYSLNMAEIWPDTSFALDLLNVGIYGESITFGGESFTVSNGSIMVDGRPVSLLVATFSGTLTDGIWTYSINNVELATSADPLPVIFSGEWSTSLIGYKMDSYNQTVTEWQPGKFALDKDDFVIVGLLGCLAAFVGLGFYGARSGHKMLALAIVCGSMALILLSLV